jgi:hypothetical protein
MYAAATAADMATLREIPAEDFVVEEPGTA